METPAASLIPSNTVQPQTMSNSNSNSNANTQRTSKKALPKEASAKGTAKISDCSEISSKDFNEKYILKKTCYGRGDFFEIR